MLNYNTCISIPNSTLNTLKQKIMKCNHFNLKYTLTAAMARDIEWLPDNIKQCNIDTGVRLEFKIK